MRTIGLSLLLLNCPTSVLFGQPLPTGNGPPGTIVITPRPNPPTIPAPPTISPPTETPRGTSVVFGTDPLRPGFLVVRPQRLIPPDVITKLPPSESSQLLPAPRQDVPHLVVIRPQPGNARPMGSGKEPVTPFLPAPPVVQHGAEPDDPKDPKVGKIVLETWDVASARGLKVGYFHVVVREFERDGKRYLYASKEMKLQIARFGQPVEQWAEDSTIETPDGSVLMTVSRQGIGKNQVLTVRGEVAGRKLKVTVDGAVKASKEVDWPEGVLGISREAAFVKDKKLRAGESVTYSVFDGRLGSVVRFTASGQMEEEVVLSPGSRPRKLLRVRMDMTPIGDFKLPPGVVWFDPQTLEQVKAEQEMSTLGGLMSVTRTTREAALQPAAKRLDLADVQSIVLAHEVPNADAAEEIVYRFKLGGELPLEKAFSADIRQSAEIIDAKARTFDLRVKAVRKPVRHAEPPARPGREFFSDCYFIDWDNEQVRQHAKAAVAGLPADADDWTRAKAVERWVNKNMKATEFSQAMATCSNVAKSLSGDCTEYSVLSAGMCRALGIASRTAIGLVYAPPQRGGLKATLAWHMWYEVWIDGEWLSLDAVLGLGSIGPDHLKVSDASWHEEKSFTPLLPLLNLLGTQPKAEVRSVLPFRR